MSQFPAGVKPRAPIFTFDAVSDSRVYEDIKRT